MIVPVQPGEGALRTLLARDGEFVRGQFAPPFGVGFDDFADFDSSRAFFIVREDDEFDLGPGAALSRIRQRTLLAERNRDNAGKCERHKEEGALWPRLVSSRWMRPRRSKFRRLSRLSPDKCHRSSYDYEL